MLNLYSDDMLIANADITPIWRPALHETLPVSVFNAECPPWDSFNLLRTNCKNCGAPLPKHGRCRYCDTENGVIVKEEKNLRKISQVFIKSYLMVVIEQDKSVKKHLKK